MDLHKFVVKQLKENHRDVELSDREEKAQLTEKARYLQSELEDKCAQLEREKAEFIPKLQETDLEETKIKNAELEREHAELIQKLQKTEMEEMKIKDAELEREKADLQNLQKTKAEMEEIKIKNGELEREKAEFIPKLQTTDSEETKIKNAELESVRRHLAACIRSVRSFREDYMLFCPILCLVSWIDPLPLGIPTVLCFIRGQVSTYGYTKIKKATFLMLLAFPVVVTGTTHEHLENTCNNIQHAILDEEGRILCHMVRDFHGAYWFDSTATRAIVVIKRESDVTSGSGFDSGEYDVAVDGTLIIHNVTVKHQRIYQVNFIRIDLPTERRNISLKVIASPSTRYPEVDVCGNDTFCVAPYTPGKDIICRHEGARPALTLMWYRRGYDGDMKMLFRNRLVSNNVTFDSVAYFTFAAAPEQNPIIQLIVCKSSGDALATGEVETKVIVDYTANYPLPPSQLMYGIQNTYIVLPAVTGKVDMFLWQFVGNNDKREILFFSAFGDDVEGTKQHLHIDADGNLNIRSLQILHEGRYILSYTKDGKNVVKVFNLTVIVLPNPPTLEVEGCLGSDECVIHAEDTYIRCSVNNFRPELEINVIDPSGVYSFREKNTHTVERNGLLSTTIEVKIHLDSEGVCTFNSTVHCIASGKAAQYFNSQVDFTILTDGQNCSSKSTNRIWPNITIVLACLCSVLMICII